MAMIDIDRKISERGLRSAMIMQVHDELVFEGPESEMSELEPLVKDSMETVLSDPDVRLIADTGIGPDWFQAKG